MPDEMVDPMPDEAIVDQPEMVGSVAGPKGGRPRQSDHAAFNGILFVLFTGIPWEDLPQELGYGCGMTCWRRLQAWQQAGV